MNQEAAKEDASYAELPGGQFSAARQRCNVDLPAVVYILHASVLHSDFTRIASPKPLLG